MLNIWDVGTLFFIPPGTNPTPVRIGGLQDISLTFKTGVKPVLSQYRFPIKFTVADNNISAVAKMAKIDGALFAELVYGKSWTPGSLKTVIDFAAIVPITGPSIVTPTFTGTFFLDLGVVDATTGLPLTRVPSAPTAGQYTVDGSGVYGFAGQLIATPVRISLAYQSTDGRSLLLNNELFQFAPTFAVLLTTVFNCKQVSFWLPMAVSEQLIMPMRLEQYAIPEFSFQAQMAPDITMGTFSFGE